MIDMDNQQPSSQEMRVCTKCGKTKSVSEFHWSKRFQRPYSRCKGCFGDLDRAFASMRRWKERNPGLAAKRSSDWAKANRDRKNRCVRARQARLRAACLAAYGDACVCCGETERRFLTIDHVNNDGAAHRREIKGDKIHSWLIRKGFPPGFQVMCWNCNLGRFRNGGICPHQMREGSETIPTGSRPEANAGPSAELEN